MPLSNCKIELSIDWYENYILSSAGTAATFAITDTNKIICSSCYFKNWRHAKLSTLLSERFKRSIYWNEYNASLKNYSENSDIKERLDASVQGVNRLCILAYAHGDNITNENSYERYFLRRLERKKCNIEIDGRNFYDHSINDSMKQYDEIRKISTGQDDDYTTGCLLDFAYFEKKYRLIAADLSKQKALGADSRAIQQIIFTGKTDNKIRVYYILEKSKETILEFAKETTKVL